MSLTEPNPNPNPSRKPNPNPNPNPSPNLEANPTLRNQVTESVRLSPGREGDVEFMPALCTVILNDERQLWQSIDELRMLSSTATPYLLRGFTVGGATLCGNQASTTSVTASTTYGDSLYHIR